MGLDKLSPEIVARARQGGADYILPDSALPIPQSIWERIDPNSPEFRDAVERLNAQEEAGEYEDLSRWLGSRTSGFVAGLDKFYK